MLYERSLKIKGQPIPSWERQIDALFDLPPAATRNEPRGEFLTKEIDPMIQPVLHRREAIGEDRGCDVRRIEWVKVV